MKGKKIVAIVLSVCMICGCQEVPKEVQDNIAQRKELKGKQEKEVIDDSDIEEEKGPEYASLEGVKENYKNIYNKTFTNISIGKDCTIKIPKVESIGVQEMQVMNSFVEQHPDLIKNFVGDSFDASYLHEDTDSEPPGPEYEDKRNATYCGVADSGFTFFTKEDDMDLNSFSLVKEYYLANGYENKEYEMKDGKLSVEKAVERAKQLQKQWTSQTGDGEYRLYKCNVCQASDRTTYFYQIQFQKLQDQMPIMQLTPGFEDLQKKEFKNSVSMQYLEIYIDSWKEDPFCFSNQCIIKKTKEREKYDKIITLDAALQRLSKMLAEYRVNKITSISLEYLMSSEEDEVGAIQEPGEKFLIRPVWMIAFDLKEEQEIYAIIDCKTGAISYVNRGEVEY